MESQVTQPGVDNIATDSQSVMEPVDQTTMTMLPPAEDTSYQMQQTGEKISAFLAALPDYISQFWNQYKQPIISIGLIFVAIIALRVLFALIGAVNDIPLVAPTFELIGIGYTVWFTNRYLLKAETRQELVADMRLMKKQVLGGNVSDSFS